MKHLLLSFVGFATALFVTIGPTTARAETVKVKHGSLEIYDGNATRLGGYGEEKTLQFVGDCALPVKIEVGRGITYRIASICGEDEWQGRDNIRALWIWERPYQDRGYIGGGKKGLPLTFSASTDPPRYEKTFPMRIHFGGRVIRRFLYAYAADHPAKRIFEGTDGFVNVCINRGLEIRSLRGVLYCETKAWNFRELQIRKRPFRVW